MNAIDTIHAVEEQDQYEDESNLTLCKPFQAMTCDRGLKYLQAILELRYERIFRDEGEQLAFHGVWKRDDKQSEDAHLEHQECEDLGSHCVSSGS